MWNALRVHLRRPAAGLLSRSITVASPAASILQPHAPRYAQTAAATSAEAAPSSSAFAPLPQEPADPILGLNAAHRNDPDPRKVNLGVGAYRTSDGTPYILPVVLKVEQQIIRDLAQGPPTNVNHEYLPQGGLPEFATLAAKALLGEHSPAIREKRTASFQVLSGTGALRVAFAFLHKLHSFLPASPPPKNVYIPSPTWSNHKNTIHDAGLHFKEYRYLDQSSGAVDVDAMCHDLHAAPNGSIVLLHACAHNPSGADPSHDQWKAIRDVVLTNKHIPLFDSAYQGFASGSLAEDASPVRMFVETGMDMLTCQSFAKNAGLYGERVGALTIISSDPATVPAIQSQVARIIRGMYSSPPAYGARIMARILGDPELFAEWEQELVIMSSRIKDMREQLFQEIVRCGGTPARWERIRKQIGMFSYTGLSAAQVEALKNEFHIYMTKDGRISMAGLTEHNVRYVAESITKAMQMAD